MPIVVATVATTLASLAPTSGVQIAEASASSSAIISSLDAPKGSIVRATVKSGDAGVAVLGASVDGFPLAGNTYLVLSTGDATAWTSGSPDGFTSTDIASNGGPDGNDLAQVELELAAPAGSTCVRFDFKFLSEEYPEYVGSQYNDTFTAESDKTSLVVTGGKVVTPYNFAYDSAGNAISVNTVFGMKPMATSQFDGTTDLLTAISPIGLTSKIVTLSIADLGDSYYDSAVLIDHLSFGSGPNCTAGAVALTDSDGDALPDTWETFGLDVDGNGSIDVDLPAMGADPRHKDLYVEVDWMKGHQPNRVAMDRVVKAFAEAPVGNPDGSSGIRLHLDAGSAYVMDNRTGATWGSRSRAEEVPFKSPFGSFENKQYIWSDFDAVKNSSLEAARRDVFRYALFIERLGSANNGTSGIARGLPGSGFIVAQGPSQGTSGPFTVTQESGTFMHELGHTLGLGHGGGDSILYKPNYLSVMNYTFQFSGLYQGNNRPLDYSRVALTTLDEASLAESDGVTPGQSKMSTSYFCNGDGKNMRLVPTGQAVDWNCNGKIDSGRISATIKVQVGQQDGTPSKAMLVGYDDWSHVVFGGGGIGALGDQAQPTQTAADELTTDEAAAVGVLYGQVDARIDALSAYTAPSTGGSLPVTVTNLGKSVDTYSLSYTGPISGVGSLEVLPGATASLGVVVNANRPDGALNASIVAVSASTGQPIASATFVVDKETGVQAPATKPNSFGVLSPARVMETRAGLSTVDGLFNGDGVRARGSVTALTVAGRGGVPGDAAAVVLNVTVAEAAGAGFVTVFPCGESQPTASSLNYVGGSVVANAVIAKVGSGGKVCVFVSEATHVVVDVTGFFPAGSSFGVLSPARVMETRAGLSTVDGLFNGEGVRARGSVTALTVAGRGGVPGDAAAVVLNVTVAEAAGAGFVTVFPCGESQPTASSLNYVGGSVVANAVIAKVGSGGKVCVFVSEATHVVVDVTGFFPAGSS